MRRVILGCLTLAAPALLGSTDTARAVPADAMEAQRCIWRCGDATGLHRLTRSL